MSAFAINSANGHLFAAIPLRLNERSFDVPREQKRIIEDMSVLIPGWLCHELVIPRSLAAGTPQAEMKGWKKGGSSGRAAIAHGKYTIT